MASFHGIRSTYPSVGNQGLDFEYCTTAPWKTGSPRPRRVVKRLVSWLEFLFGCKLTVEEELD